MVLAVCAGYQIVGRSFPDADGALHEGVGLLDVTTAKGAGPRAGGEVQAEVTAFALPPLTGFENHGGRTHLGPDAEPLGHVLRGYGNNGGDGREGARSGNVIGTYLHGPLLPKNSWFADWLIATGLGDGIALAPLDDDLEELAHADARRAAGL